MTVDIPQLKVSPNSWRGNTASREYGRKNENEPRFDGEWVIRNQSGHMVNFYHSVAYVERYYPGTMIIEFLGDKEAEN